ncbi:MAG TPA: type IV pilus biogenesis/stability protein PilW [Gammaproteobacteria bacterium]|jgi:type IV pilus assembly protein PilF
MIRRLLLCTPLLVLLLGACVTTSNSPFQSDKTSMKQAAQDNVALAIQYLRAGNRDAAMEKVQKAIDEDPDSANAYTAEALIYGANGDVANAKSAYRTAMRKAPDDPEIQNDYAVFLCQHGDARGSIDYFMKAATNPRYSTPDGAYSNAGLCAQQIPDYAAADQYFRQALARNPTMLEPLAQLAAISYRQKNYLSARAFIERFDSLAPNSRPDVLLLGVDNERALGNQQSAVDYAKRLIRLYPTSIQAQQLQQGAPRG